MVNKPNVIFFVESMEEQRQDLLAQFKQERRRWEQERLKLESDLQGAESLLNQMKGDMKSKEEHLTKDAHLGLSMEAVS